MAKEYEVKCPYCKNVRKVVLAENLWESSVGIGMAMTYISKMLGKLLFTTLRSFRAEENWIDLKNPCPNCNHTFSFNIVTGESRE